MITTHFSGQHPVCPAERAGYLYVVINEQSRVEIIKEVFGVVVPAVPQITYPVRVIGRTAAAALEVQPSDEYNVPVDDEPGPLMRRNPGR